MSELSTSDFLSSLPAWNRFLDEYQLPPVMSKESSLRELRLRCLNLRRRLRDGPLAPLRMAFFGPTGAGKSKLFSSLIGRSISHSGYRRPFTRKSCYYVHDAWQPLVAALQGQVEMHDEPEWKDIILVDTPDFDSVELANRDEAERVFLEADSFLFVTDALKYADASTWEYLARIHSAGKQFVVILNKVSSTAISESFNARYRDTFKLTMDQSLPYTTIVVPEFPIGDEDLIDPQHESLRALHVDAKSLAGDEPAGQSVQRFQGELTGIFDRSNELLQEVRLRRSQVAQLQTRLDERYQEAVVHLEHRLAEGLEPAVRDEVYQRVQRKLDSIDLLRYPRKVIAMPIQGLRSLYDRWAGKEGLDRAKPTKDEITDPVTTETFHMLESELIRFADESRLDVIQQPGLDRLMDRERFKSLRLKHVELQGLFREQHAEFRTWVETHARDTAAEITGENKLKFILSQVLFHTVVIGAQFKTAGGLSLLEVGFDGVVSPFVAKAVSIAIGNEKVKEFEIKAHERHQEALAQIIAVGRDRFLTYLQESSRGLDELEAKLSQIVAFQPQTDQLVEKFRLSALSQPTSSEAQGND